MSGLWRKVSADVNKLEEIIDSALLALRQSLGVPPGEPLALLEGIERLEAKRSTAYREGYEAGQRQDPDLRSLKNAERCGYANGEAAGRRATEEKYERVNRELRDSLDKRDAAIRTLHQEAEERIHECATRATERDAWRDKCGALEEALKVADKERDQARATLRTLEEGVTRDREKIAQLKSDLARSVELCAEANRSLRSLRALREKLAALVNEKA